MADQNEFANPREVSNQLGTVLAEIRYLQQRLLSAREATLTRKTRACVTQLLHAAESLDKARLMLADVMDQFTGDVSDDEADAALHNELRKALGTTEKAA
jgi:molecular chaperone GrpE (heat shock protein)